MSTKVLIIEDEESLAELIRVNLNAGGFEVDVARDGEEGLRKVASGCPGVVILDVRLPVMDGWKVCREIKGNPGSRRIPVIILTAATQKSDFEESKRSGCDLYLAKPFDPFELVEAVRGIVKGQDGNGFLPGVAV